MRLEGTLYHGNVPGPRYLAIDEDPKHPFYKQMENCLLEICKGISIPIPLWMKKNSRELGAFRQTVFTAEQFLEPVHFDRFVLRLI